jgi:hypothetical protein
MRVRVEFDLLAPGGARLARFRMGGFTVEVVEILDRWQGEDADHFKVAGDDGHTYVLRRDSPPTNDWQMVSFTHRDSRGTSPDVPAVTTWLQ